MPLSLSVESNQPSPSTFSDLADMLAISSEEVIPMEEGYNS
jgi:hypothetical protein